MADAAPVMLDVAGNRLLEPDGTAVRLQGVNVPSLEWSSAGENVLTSVRVAMDEWRANAIRLPLAQDRWFGLGAADGGAAYRALVDAVVAEVAARDGYVILDLHWSDAGVWNQAVAQHRMPDQNSVTFWQDVARRYANHPAVLFGLYNEPHDVPWSVWRDGGRVEEEGVPPYQTPGLQGLLDAVRATGARNVAVAGGLDWAYDLSGVAAGYALADPGGNGVIYDTHIYSWKGNTSAQWDRHLAATAAAFPILVGEVWCEPDPKQEDCSVWVPKVLDYLDARGFHWMAWTFHPAATPRLLSDWDYTPTPYWGVYVRAKLLQGAQSPPPA